MKETEKAYKNKQKQNGRQKNFGGKYGVFLALIVLCVLILADSCEFEQAKCKGRVRT